jgi:lipoprotein-releasing system ATP-binding protein
MNNECVIECQNLSQVFEEGSNRVEVFHDLNLKIHRGERLAIVGASGSGKSTLLYLLGGLDKINTGKVLINGQDIARLGTRKLGSLRNQALGFVYQFHHLLPEFSALENVAMPLLIRGEKPEQAQDKAATFLSHVGLENRLKHRPGELSGGERQRAAIARALVTEPACLLADEPTGNLDNATARQVYELLLKLNEEMRISMVLVTHDENLASKMDKIMLLSDGCLTEMKRKVD